MGVSLYLTVDGVTGASVAEHHHGAVECSSWAWGLVSQGRQSGGSHGGGKARPDEVVVTMPTTAALPQLLTLCASGRTVARAQLAATDVAEGVHVWLRVTLTDVAVTRVATAASAPEQCSDDEVHLGFETITVEHVAQGPDGAARPATVFAWDARRQRPLSRSDKGPAADGSQSSERVADEAHDDPEGEAAGVEATKRRKGKRGQPTVKARGKARLLD